MNKQPIISFFSGCGSFDLGFSSAGFSVELALDVDPMAVETYNHNCDRDVCHVADLTQLDGQGIIKMYGKNRSVGVPLGVIGGAPCQTFSIANRNFRGDDPRHMLPRRYACILRVLNLKYDLDFFVLKTLRALSQINTPVSTIRSSDCFLVQTSGCLKGNLMLLILVLRSVDYGYSSWD